MPLDIHGPTKIQLVDDAGNIYGVKQIEGKPRVSAIPYLYDIAEKHISGHEAFFKLGYNNGLDTTEEDIWDVGGTYIFPGVAQQMKVVSSDVNDTSGGYGIQSVKVHYLDNNFGSSSEVVVLNGSSPVYTFAQNIYRINALRAYTVGTSGVAIGNISVKNSGETIIYRQINTGYTRGRGAIYTVPSGKTLYITSIAISSGHSTAGKNVRWTARATYDDADEIVTSSGRFFMPWFELQTQDSAFHRDFEIPNYFPATVDIKVSAVSDQAGGVGTCALRGWLE